MTTPAAPRPEHLQKLYSAYEEARPTLAHEIANVFCRKSGCASLHGKKLLDVGCGNGEISEAFSEMGLSVTGVEYSSSRVAKMGANKRNFHLVAGDGHYLPLQSSFFDLAVLADLLEHVYDPPRLMREVARVVKPGGLVFIGATNRCSIANLLTDPHYRAPFVPLMSKKLATWYIVTVLKYSNSFNVEKYFFPNQLRRIINDAGFLCEHLPMYRDRFNKGELTTSVTRGAVMKRLLAFAYLRRAAVALTSTWLFKTLVAPTVFHIAVRDESRVA